MHKVGRGWTSILGWTAVGVVTGLLLPGLASAGTPILPPLPAAAGEPTWAYGGFKSVNVSGHGNDIHGAFEYSIRAYYGWQVILDQQNLTNGDIGVSSVRTQAANFYADLCRPSCALAGVTSNLTYKAVELAHGYAVFDPNGTVYANGTAVPAYALVNASSQSAGNISAVAAISTHGLLGSQSGGGSFYAWANSSVDVGFTPSLGLYPINATSGETWNSTASFVGAGTYSVNYDFTRSPLTGTASNGSDGWSGSVNSTGTVSISGSDGGALTLGDGTVVRPVSLVLAGPFALREGFLFLPAGADLFANQAQSAFTPYQGGAESAGTQAVDVAPGAAGAHVGLVSSATAFSSSPSSTDIPAAGSGSQVLPAATDVADSTGPVVVQGQPETVATAQSWTDCLASNDCPIPGTSAPVRGVVVAAVGVVLVAVIAAVVVAGRRRRIPPPPRPQAALYPPPGARAPSNVPPPPPGEDDALSHLW